MLVSEGESVHSSEPILATEDEEIVRQIGRLIARRLGADRSGAVRKLEAVLSERKPLDSKSAVTPHPVTDERGEARGEAERGTPPGKSYEPDA